MESNHRRRRIRSLCFRYNTGQSGRRESNPRSRAPKAREAPFLFLPISFLRCSDPCGIRTQPLQLERLTTSPEVERAMLLYARTLSAVGREALESSSAAFQATAKPSQLPTHLFVAWFPPLLPCFRSTKKARCPCDTGLLSAVRPFFGQGSQAQGMRQIILSERIISPRGITLRYAFLDRTWS